MPSTFANNLDRTTPFRLVSALAWVIALGATTVGIASAVPTGSAPGVPDGDVIPPAPLAGNWFTVANGDRVHDVLREGDTVWAATDGGGVVRWSISTGVHRQYLAPQDGLASNDVRQLLRARDGTLWAATGDGLARLSAASDRWTVVRPDHPELPSSSATALAQAPDGSLWVGFEQRWDPDAPSPGLGEPGAFVGGGLARLDTRGLWGRVVHAVVTDDPDDRPRALPSENVTSIAFGTDGVLWVGTRPFHYWSEDACSNPPCPPEEAAYITTGGGLAATGGLEDGWRHWNTLTDVCPASTDIVNDLRADVDGRMWVATRGRGLQLYRGGTSVDNCDPASGHTQFKPGESGLPGPHVWGVDVDDEGRVWMTVGDGKKGLGVAVLDHKGTFDEGAGGADDGWFHIGLDGFTDRVDAVATGIDEFEGEAVVGTRDDRLGDGWGVKHIDADGAWRTLATADTGLPSNQITAIASHPQRGEVWFGTRNRGAVRWSGTEWRRFHAFAPQAAVGDIAERAIRGSETITLTVPLPVFQEAFPPGSLRLAHLGSDPIVYELDRPRAAGDRTRVDVRPPLPQTFPPGTAIAPIRREIAGDHVTSIAFDASGHVWLGATRSVIRPAPPYTSGGRCETTPDCWRDGGVAAYDGRAWTIHNPRASENALPIRSVLALGLDSAGRLWAGTGVPSEDRGDGVAIFDPGPGTWEVKSRFTEGAAFGGDVVSGVAVDPLNGDVWLATQHTVCQGGAVEGDCDENHRMGGGVSRYNGSSWTKWTKREGSSLRANGTDGNFSSILFDDARGYVWASGWDEGPGGLHWLEGRGIDAVSNRCGRTCSDETWDSWVFRDDGVAAAQAVDAEGRVWIGASRDNLGEIPPDGGVRIFHGDRAVADGWWWLDTDAISREVTTLARQGDGMWVGTFDGGASRWWPVELSPGAYLPSLRR